MTNEYMNCNAAAVVAKPPCTVVHPVPTPWPSAAAAILDVDMFVCVLFVCVLFAAVTLAVYDWLPLVHAHSTTTAGEADPNSIMESTGTIRKLTSTFTKISRRSSDVTRPAFDGMSAYVALPIATGGVSPCGSDKQAQQLGGFALQEHAQDV